MTPTHGSRIGPGGYQFPATDAVGLKREKPIRNDGPIGPYQATAQLVPLTGGRPDLFEICSQWLETKEVAGQTGPTSVLTAFMVEGRELAEKIYAATVDTFRDGELPPTE